MGTWYLCFPAPRPGSGPDPRPQFVFGDPGPKFVFHGPGHKFVFHGPGPQFVFTGPGPQFVFALRFTVKVCYSYIVYLYKLSAYLYVLTC